MFRYLFNRLKASLRIGIKKIFEISIHKITHSQKWPLTPTCPMLFHQGKKAFAYKTDQTIEQIVSTVKEYKEVLAKRDIRFIFVIIPNKESIYYQYIPDASRPDFLPRLEKRLIDENIETINPYQ